MCVLVCVHTNTYVHHTYVHITGLCLNKDFLFCMLRLLATMDYEIEMMVTSAMHLGTETLKKIPASGMCYFF